MLWNMTCVTLIYDLMLLTSCYTGSEPIVDPHAFTARTLQLSGIWHQATSDVTEVASEGQPSRRHRCPSFRLKMDGARAWGPVSMMAADHAAHGHASIP